MNAHTGLTSDSEPRGRLLRMPEVVRECGISRMTIYRRIKAGEFPKPYELGPNSVAWFESDVERWKASRRRRS